MALLSIILARATCRPLADQASRVPPPMIKDGERHGQSATEPAGIGSAQRGDLRLVQSGVGPISHGVCHRCRLTRLESELGRLPLPAPTTANGEPSERSLIAGPNEEAA